MTPDRGSGRGHRARTGRVALLVVVAVLVAAGCGDEGDGSASTPVRQATRHAVARCGGPDALRTGAPSGGAGTFVRRIAAFRRPPRADERAARRALVADVQAGRATGISSFYPDTTRILRATSGRTMRVAVGYLPARSHDCVSARRTGHELPGLCLGSSCGFAVDGFRDPCVTTLPPTRGERVIAGIVPDDVRSVRLVYNGEVIRAKTPGNVFVEMRSGLSAGGRGLSSITWRTADGVRRWRCPDRRRTIDGVG